MNAPENHTEFWKAGKRLNDEIKVFYTVRVRMQGKHPREIREFVRETVRTEKQLRKAIDDACQLWIDSGKWPQRMEPIHAIQISDRLGEGLLLCEFLISYGFDCPQKTEKEILKFLLIDAWAAIGRKAVAARLVM